MNYRIYEFAKALDGRGVTTPLMTFSEYPTYIKSEIIQALTDHPALCAKYIECYEFLDTLRGLRHKREWLQSRGYPVVEQLDDTNNKIWDMVPRVEPLLKDYEMLRRLFAYEITALELKE